MHHEDVTVEISVDGAGTIPNGYQFRLDVVPAETGFQIATTGGVCDFSQPPASDTESSGWYSATLNPHILQIEALKLGKV